MLDYSVHHSGLLALPTHPAQQACVNEYTLNYSVTSVVRTGPGSTRAKQTSTMCYVAMIKQFILWSPIKAIDPRLICANRQVPRGVRRVDPIRICVLYGIYTVRYYTV